MMMGHTGSSETLVPDQIMMPGKYSKTFIHVSFLFADDIHAATFATGKRLGCYKIGIYVEAFGVFYLVPVWCGTHPAVYLEHGKLRTLQTIDYYGVLSADGRIILKWFIL
jgi:hypothetical protein